MKLIIINVVVFIAANLFIGLSKLSNSSTDLLFSTVALAPDLTSFLGHFWTLFTYMFVHIELFHVLFNLLWLYWMGQLFVEFIGSKQLISTYIFGGIFGGVLFLISGYLFPAVLGGAPLVGASAGVMAVVIAIAFLIPNYTLSLFLIGPVKLKYIALVSFVLSTIIDFYTNTGGKIAHIGGALYGYLFISLYRNGTDFGKPINAIIDWTEKLFSPKPKMTVTYRKPNDEDYNVGKRAAEKRVDEILDKISKSGYDSLSKDEKEFLFQQSGKK